MELIPNLLPLFKTIKKQKKKKTKQKEKLKKGMHSTSLSGSVRICTRVSHSIIHLHARSLYPFVFPSLRRITITPKKAPPSFRSPIRTRSHTRMKNQETYQATVSATELNVMKNELKNLTQLMTIMMGRFENQTPLPIAQDSGSSQSTPSNEVPNFQSAPMPSAQINILQPRPP